ncbi:hypothetical protein AMAG_01468 [Allomyces macrogynus ATCC 38327]|uniref:Uncharacterized protein n=1 Tax=Allomyces macrogynus (strain ATCC 38327) TaxID=578462 RepID=A0A0L0RYW4_ALLM3|nr:hypothetical protein AMAG_01468 [Allomyces macrogynus ATCC 38327]|eukprot:KNE55577.1 hypothetical protein AMAG_01468 [Allomyces macrogynus ATCC 38327]
MSQRALRRPRRLRRPIRPSRAPTLHRRQPTARPSTHGMVTTDFLADFLDMLDTADSGSDQEVPSAPAAIPVATRAVTPGQPQLHSQARNRGPFCGTVVCRRAGMLGAQRHGRCHGRDWRTAAPRAKDPLGPTRVKAMVDYLYLKCQDHNTMRLCRARVDHVTRPKGPGRTRPTAYRDMAETGLRAAYQLRDEDAAIKVAKYLTPMDGNLSYLLGTFHQFFPAAALGAHPRAILASNDRARTPRPSPAATQRPAIPSRPARTRARAPDPRHRQDDRVPDRTQVLGARIGGARGLPAVAGAGIDRPPVL